MECWNTGIGVLLKEITLFITEKYSVYPIEFVYNIIVGTL
jgi:hypothetical protein